MRPDGAGIGWPGAGVGHYNYSGRILNVGSPPAWAGLASPWGEGDDLDCLNSVEEMCAKLKERDGEYKASSEGN